MLHFDKDEKARKNQERHDGRKTEVGKIVD